MKGEMKKKKVFILDDEPDVLDILTMMLNSTGKFETSGSISPEEALNILFIKDRFDILLLDIAMPDIDGWEILDLIKSSEETKKLKVILITARSSDRSKILAIQKGASDFISKPFHKEQILKSIEKVLLETE